MVLDVTSYHYASGETAFLHSSLSPEGPIRIQTPDKVDLQGATRGALRTLELAKTLSIDVSAVPRPFATPYSEESQQLTFPAPMISALVQNQVLFLRGWSRLESCLKGLNALGLMAEQVDRQMKLMPDDFGELRSTVTLEYLKSRKDDRGVRVYNNRDLQRMEKEDRLAGSVDILELAIWKCFSDRPIICSTSSNLGISLHEVLCQLRAEVRETDAGEHHLFNWDEGRLIIWCPDERADFMSAEKAEMLRQIATSSHGTTTLRSYIDRQQRDPAALRESLDCGGYFFPTNPQSVHELKNLLTIVLSMDDGDPVESLKQRITNSDSRITLESLGCEFLETEPAVRLTRGIEGGIYGMMLPYFLLNEELAQQGTKPQLSVWNQASIGAALAAAVLANQVVENPGILGESGSQAFAASFPAVASGRSSELISKADTGRSQIHGVFDLANMQSLAQLLGVVVTRHHSGRSTSYVGLGSSSYSNGNRCYEILDTDFRSGGAFGGRDNFHPATHAVNPVAQALIYGEDVRRARAAFGECHSPDTDLLDYVSCRVRKPEPAGAASLAGLLLYLLDREDLSVFELANGLRVAGFTKYSFLEFLNFGHIDEAEIEFSRLSTEEGPFMGQLAADLMNLLEWPVEVLHNRSEVQRESRPRQSEESKDVEEPSVLVIYLTGDNTEQPQSGFLDKVIRQQEAVESVQLHGPEDTRHGNLSI
jgi:hypothetical protein